MYIKLVSQIQRITQINHDDAKKNVYFGSAVQETRVMRTAGECMAGILVACGS